MWALAAAPPREEENKPRDAGAHAARARRRAGAGAPPHSAWAWSETHGRRRLAIISRRRVHGGAPRGRLLAYYAQDIGREAARWRGAREAFEREAGKSRRRRRQQQAQLRRWGLRRLRRPFAELAAARAARARAQAAARRRPRTRCRARRRGRGVARGRLLVKRCSRPASASWPPTCFAKSATLKARRAGLRARDEAVERAAAAARALRSRVAGADAAASGPGFT